MYLFNYFQFSSVQEAQGGGRGALSQSGNRMGSTVAPKTLPARSAPRSLRVSMRTCVEDNGGVDGQLEYICPLADASGPLGGCFRHE